MNSAMMKDHSRLTGNLGLSVLVILMCGIIVRWLLWSSTQISGPTDPMRPKTAPWTSWSICRNILTSKLNPNWAVDLQIQLPVNADVYRAHSWDLRLVIVFTGFFRGTQKMLQEAWLVMFSCFCTGGIVVFTCSFLYLEFHRFLI